MQESYAYRVLSLSARKVMDRLEIELARHGFKPEENGQLRCSYEHFVEYGIHRHAIGPGIRECEALGFLDAEHGQAGNREFRSASKYRLTYRPVGRAQPTNEWRRIQTMEEAEAIARAARKQKTSAGKRTAFGAENQHRKPDFSVPDSVTSVSVPDSATTSRISGPISALRARECAQAAPQQSPAHPPGHRSRARQGVRGKNPHQV